MVCPKAPHVPSYHAKFVLILCYIFVLIDSMHTHKGSTKALLRLYEGTCIRYDAIHTCLY